MAPEVLQFRIESILADMAEGWRLLGKSPAEIAELIEWKRPHVVAEWSEPTVRRSVWQGRVATINEHSTLNYAQQGISPNRF